jgi:hypothetical protein
MVDKNDEMMWIKEAKRSKLLITLKLKGWISAGNNKQGVPFTEFESITAKLHHAFLALQGNYHHATGSFASTTTLFSSIKTTLCSQQSRTCAPFYMSPQ